MRLALQEAKRAYDEGEVPVGAILVHQERAIARGHNQVELLKDATAHAEMVAITQASAHFENWRLLDTTLYCTVEPCVMCFGAMMLSRIKRLVIGAPDLRHGALGSWVNLLETKHPTHHISMTKGVLEADCSLLMTQFFQEQRKRKQP